MAQKIQVMVYLQGQSLNQQPDIQFASFRSDLANILGCCIHTVGAKGTLCNATMAPESPETPVPTKHRKKEDESTITAPIVHVH